MGRCTRGYAAYFVQEDRLVFLKDCWRVDDGITLSEIDIYRILFSQKEKDLNLPDIVAMGDVIVNDQPQATVTQELTREHKPGEFLCDKLIKMVHMRIVEELAIPLDSAENSKEAVWAINDAAVCVLDVYELHMYHRDVSVRNIMIRDKTNPAYLRYKHARSTGILNDWDHAIKFDLRPITHEYRTGTWVFMSIKHLRYPESSHEVHDDLESILWVLVFIALHRFKQNDPADFSLDFFNEMDYRVVPTRQTFPTGGNKKVLVLQDGLLGLIDFVSSPVATLLRKLVNEFRHYSPHIPSPRAVPLPIEEQTPLSDRHRRLQCRDTTLSIFRDALRDPAWVLDDWAAVDKYPSQSANTKQKEIAVHDSDLLRAGSGMNRDLTGSGSLQSSHHSHSRPGRNTTTFVEDRRVPSVTHSISSQRSSMLPGLSAHRPSRPSSASSSIKRRAHIAGLDDGEDSIIKKTRMGRCEEDQRRSPSALFRHDFPQGDSDIHNALWSQDDDLDLCEDSQSARPLSACNTPPLSSPASSPRSLHSSIDPLDIPGSHSPTANSEPEDVAPEESYADPLGAATASSMSSAGGCSTRVDLWRTTSRPPVRTYAKKDRKGKGKARRD
ncbi:hypothetical protein QCA50_010832 [Cerrena zonata]|uniref:Fungal-type protein kinase domain-containing protein n=1 Tax=Cerrena zonata TaxID=2478898 RepID=A0AAW0FZ25_9APHY